jgi:hypothetical protein
MFEAKLLSIILGAKGEEITGRQKNCTVTAVAI